jgi:hypothetical protein
MIRDKVRNSDENPRKNLVRAWSEILAENGPSV